MKNYKQFIAGLIVGAMLLSVVPISAAIEEYICYKADYKVMVNGTEYTNAELPILNYKGNTYAPFRSILEAAGLNVGWNAELHQAEVTSTTNLSLNESEVSTMSTTTDLFKTYTLEGIEYIRVKDITIKYTGYQFSSKNSTKEKQIVDFIDANNKTLIENVPFIINNGLTYVSKDYFYNTILPLIN